METAVNITSLIVALVSLFIAIGAYIISKQTLIYTSREFLPQIEWDIDNKGVLRLKNLSAGLFEIIRVGLVKIDYFGYEDMEKQQTVHIPLVTESRQSAEVGSQKKIIISPETAFACCYICPYPEDKISFVSNKIENFYNNESSTKLALPYLRSVIYLIEIAYKNKFRETKTLHYKKQHFHGSGFFNSTITDEAFAKFLQLAQIPKFQDNNMLWEYLVKKFSKNDVYANQEN